MKFTLYISYTGHKYRKWATYDTLKEALSEFERFINYHTNKGDRLKLITSAK